MQSPARRGMLAVFVGLLALALMTPAASAAKFNDGTLRLTLSTKFNKKLNKAKVKTSATSGAKKSGRRFTFDIGTSTATLAVSPTGTLKLDGGLRFSKGKTRLSLSSLQERLASTSATFSGRVSGKRLSLFTQRSSGKVTPTAQFDGLEGKSLSAKLTSAAAKSLNKRFKTSFKRNETAGTISFSADRQLDVQPGGNSDLIFDGGTAVKFQSCAGGPVEIQAVAPAQRTPPGSGAPAGGLRLPLVSGQLDAKTLDGTLNHDGGARLFQPSTNKEIRLLQPTASLTGTGGVLTADSSLSAARLAIADLDLSAATRSKSLTAEGGTVTIRDALAKLNGTAAFAINATFGCSTFQAGDPLGRLNSDIPVS